MQAQFNDDLPEHNFNASQREMDKSLLVKFFMKPKQDKEETEKHGRPIYKDIEHIDIRIGGNRSGGACRPASQEDKRRFPDHYKAFKERINDDDVTEGTLLTEWSYISRSQAEELRFFHVKTVEQLANMADTQVSQFLGLMSVKQKAIKWLERVALEKPMWEMDQKIRAQDEVINDLKGRLSDLLNQLSDNDDEGLNDMQKKTKIKRAIKAAKEQVS